ncbi:MAG: hypothetical protein Q9162_002914 [Coniocarpon cinnabarinum]
MATPVPTALGTRPVSPIGAMVGTLREYTFAGPASLLVNAVSRISQWKGSKATNIDRHQCRRVVPMKVLILGLSRTGTSCKFKPYEDWDVEKEEEGQTIRGGKGEVLAPLTPITTLSHSLPWLSPYWAIREALRALGYSEIYHASAIYFENPRDVDMWLEAFEGKFDGTRGKFQREDWDRLLGHCMAISDVPCVPHFDEDLLTAYPEAKVVLSVRDSPEQWWKSVSSTLVPFAEFQERQYTWADAVWRFFMPRLRFDE